jgi:hypothetical protein
VQPYFAISWLLTWFSHVVDDWETIVRIFDSCMASHPLFTVYVSVAVLSSRSCLLLQIVVYRRHEILAEVCEYGALYKLLGTLPHNLDWEVRSALSDSHAVSSLACSPVHRAPPARDAC